MVFQTTPNGKEICVDHQSLFALLAFAISLRVKYFPFRRKREVLKIFNPLDTLALFMEFSGQNHVGRTHSKLFGITIRNLEALGVSASKTRLMISCLTWTTKPLS